MGSNRPAVGLVGALLAVAVAPTALVGTGASPAGTTCGSLNRQNRVLSGALPARYRNFKLS
jgi:hypothetical protein